MSDVDDALQAAAEHWAGYSEAETLAQEFRWAQNDLARARIELDRRGVELDRRGDEITELGNKLVAAHRRIAELETPRHPWVAEAITDSLTRANPENPS